MFNYRYIVFDESCKSIYVTQTYHHIPLSFHIHTINTLCIRFICIFGFNSTFFKKFNNIHIPNKYPSMFSSIASNLASIASIKSHKSKLLNGATMPIINEFNYYLQPILSTNSFLYFYNQIIYIASLNLLLIRFQFL